MAYTQFQRWLLSRLTDEQKVAVTLPSDANAVIVAGAGTGKTTVLTSRVAWLATQGVKLRRMLVTTFTNRAAKEFEERFEHMFGSPKEGVAHADTGTYHSIAARIIRTNAEEISELLNLNPPITEDYSILDEDEAIATLREAARPDASEGVEEKFTLPDEDARKLARHREAFLREEPSPEAFAEALDIDDVTVELKTPGRRGHNAKVMPRDAGEVMRRYEHKKRRMNVLDYNDLICIAVRALEYEPRLAPSYEAVLADEYQDTDAAQDRMLQALRANPRGTHQATLWAVGDPDQLIFAWRGARVENILGLSKRAQARQCTLTENFRSPKPILDAANAALDANRNRVKKKLTSKIETPPTPTIWGEEWQSAHDEAKAVVERIRESMKGNGRKPGDFAVLARTGRALSLTDNELARARIPYRVVAGRQFAARAEIRDVAAWMRTLLNPRDDAATEQCLLRRKRSGFGNRSAEIIREAAETEGTTMMDMAAEMASRGALNQKATDHAHATHAVYRDLLGLLDRRVDTRQMVSEIIERSGIGDDAREGLKSEDPDERDIAKGRVKRLDDLRQIAADHPSLRSLSEQLALAEQKMDNPTGESVTLSTIHQAKGLEWPEVNIIALEEGLFPSTSRRTAGDEKLEEERRCLHVAITRAQKRCTLSWSRWRHESAAQRSPFIEELGATIKVRVHERRRREERDV